MKALRKHLGQKIFELRTGAGLTQEALAEHLEVHGSYIGLLERGMKTPSLELLCRIAEYFNTDPADLLARGTQGEAVELKQILNLLKARPQKDLDKVYRILQIAFDR